MAIKQTDTGWQITEAAWGDTPERVIGTFATEHAADAFARLEEYMSDISERCYAAGWMSGLEYALWEAVVYGGIGYGLGYIAGDEVAELRRLSAACGGWCDGDVFVPLDTWRERVARERPEPEYVAFSDAHLARMAVTSPLEDAIPGLIAAYRIARGTESRIAVERLDAMAKSAQLYRRIHQLETLLGVREITVNRGEPTYEDVVMALDRLLSSSNVVSSREQMDARDRASELLSDVRQSGLSPRADTEGKEGP